MENIKEYVEKGEYAPKLDLEFVKRKNVALIIKYLDNYLFLKWNEKLNYRSLVTGGIEENESIMQCAIRELSEETGYYDIKKLELVDAINISKFYVEHKKQNREALYFPVLVELNSLEKRDISEEEKEQHDFVWLKLSEVKEFGLFENHIYMFYKIFEGV
jgi:8-oxo-dGTP pyrophosphatase MutT (NUDIX family)